MSTEKEKMLNGKIYDPTDEELAKLRTRAHILSKDYNDTYETDEEKREEILNVLVPNRGKGLYLQGAW
jgi:maltose O-acetyltransferase